MRRKLVQQGKSTLMVSLPARWCRTKELEKGDEVDLQVRTDGILVASDTQPPIKETAFVLDSTTETHIRTMVTNAYRGGFDRITVNISDPGQLDQLAHTVRSDLIGFDITTSSETQCIIEDLVTPDDTQFDAIFPKILLNIDELFRLAKSGLLGKPMPELSDVEHRIKRYDNYCRRIIAKRDFQATENLYEWTFMHTLMHAQRSLYLLLRDGPIDENATTLRAVSDCETLYLTIKDAYNSQSLEPLSEVHKLHVDFVSNHRPTLSRGGSGAMQIHYLLESARKFYLSSSPLIGYLLFRSTPDSNP